LKNIQRLKENGIDNGLMLLRIPALSTVSEVVASTSISLNSELNVLKEISTEAQRQGKSHKVILMVELGDLREGIMPDELMGFVEQASSLPAINIIGLGSNLACFAGVVPSEENMQQLVASADEVETRFGLQLDVISGINSSGLELIAAGKMPKRINHARIGEAILLGCETTHRRPWPGTCQDAFTLYAEIIELKEKPSRPVGEIGEDAFGHQSQFENKGTILRALLNIGREDLVLDGIKPQDNRCSIIGASSGYLALYVTAARGELRVGDVIGFSVNYSALLAAMTSEYVEKVVQESNAVLPSQPSP
jgi:predicted amino acid racemase